MKLRTGKEIVTALYADADAFQAGRLGLADLGVRNRRHWAEAEAGGLTEEVNRLLREGLPVGEPHHVIVKRPSPTKLDN